MLEVFDLVQALESGLARGGFREALALVRDHDVAVFDVANHRASGLLGTFGAPSRAEVFHGAVRDIALVFGLGHIELGKAVA